MTADPWTVVRTGPRIRVPDLVVGDIPASFGVYAWFRDNDVVYAGKAAGKGGLRKRLRSHLNTSTDLSHSSLRRNVAEQLLAIPTKVSSQRPTVVTVQQAAVVNAWLAECELTWVPTPTAAAAGQLERDLFAEWRPPLSKR